MGQNESGCFMDVVVIPGFTVYVYWYSSFSTILQSDIHQGSAEFFKCGNFGVCCPPPPQNTSAFSYCTFDELITLVP